MREGERKDLAIKNPIYFLFSLPSKTFFWRFEGLQAYFFSVIRMAIQFPFTLTHLFHQISLDRYCVSVRKRRVTRGRENAFFLSLIGENFLAVGSVSFCFLLLKDGHFDSGQKKWQKLRDRGQTSCSWILRAKSHFGRENFFSELCLQWKLRKKNSQRRSWNCP